MTHSSYIGEIDALGAYWRDIATVCAEAGVDQLDRIDLALEIGVSDQQRFDNSVNRAIAQTQASIAASLAEIAGLLSVLTEAMVRR